MSIPLREGFVDETLERCLEDLLVRFIVNCPDEDLSSIERVLFQIEEAHWFYQDYLRTLNPLLPSMKMKLFTNKLIEQCPFIWKWGDPSEALTKFGKYKSTIPVRGCALLNTSMDKMLLVKGIESSSWGFPRGKISKDESDVDCALRELEEETGFDASNLIDEDLYIERTIRGKNYKIYIIKGIPDNTKFIPKVRFEIADIQWMDIKYLTKAIKTTGNYYLVGSMLKAIVSYIKRIKNNETEEELKRLATIQLKKILGIDKSLVEKEEVEKVDPGRELLSMLQHAAKNPQLPSEINKQNGINPLELQKQIQFQQHQRMLMQQHQQFAHPFLPNNLMAFQQNRMVPMHAHNPFALQMFNPYVSFPPYGFSNTHPHLNNNNPSQILKNNLSSQEMSIAPSASTFSKPQFSLSNKKPNNENSKELLNILKSKPIAKDSKQSDSAELLSLLKKVPKKNPVFQKTSNNTPTGPIKILKREKPILKVNELNESNETEKFETFNNKNKKINDYQQPLDITQPANKTTTRDINNPFSNGKPIVLLKKSMSSDVKFTSRSNSNISNDSQSKKIFEDTIPSIDNKNSSIKQSIPVENIKNGQQGQNSRARTPISVNSLNLLTEPNSPNNKIDPSAQLLNILKNPIVEQKDVNVQPKTFTDPSKDLLNFLKNKSTKETQTTTSTSIDPSKTLLESLKVLPKEPSPIINDPSKDLLNILKKNDLPNSAEQIAQNVIPAQANQSPSTNTSSELLNLLHGNKSISSNIMSPELSQQKLQSASASASADLLDILKKTSNNNPIQSNLAPQLSNSSSPINTNPMFQRQFQQPPQIQQLPPQQQPVAFMQQNNMYQPSIQPVQNQSTALLDILKSSSSSNSPLTKQNQFLQPQQNISQYQSPLPISNQSNQSANVLAMLKGSASTAPSIVQDTSTIPTVDFQDFADFNDFEDAEIEGDYILNGGLYDA
jgi:mRNA-decapping enzyme subunit 2